MPIDVDLYLSKTLSAAPADLQPLFEKIRRLHSKKLWHQLTLAIFEFLDHPLSPPFQVDFFENFVREFEAKLNALKLVEIGVRISKQLTGPNTILEFLSSLRSRIDQSADPAAYILALASLAHAKLAFGDLVGTKTDIDECLKLLDNLEGAERIAKADYAPYYKNSLLYLACIDPDTDLEPQERLERAHDLAVSALLGDTIYNFGELLMHPILDALDGSPFSWIKDMLFTFNEGNIGKFESLSPRLPQEQATPPSYGRRYA
ncbi:26S proteasome regulatory subunit [Tulasnella sp. 427]|nr:26S proteasome regulatory subunit [Tulasnella sp. 427]